MMLRWMSTLAFSVACTAVLLAQGEPAGGPVKVTRILDMPQTRVAQVAHFFTAGTMHGFHNPNARITRWVELFALKTANAVAMDEGAARELAVALARSNADAQHRK